MRAAEPIVGRVRLCLVLGAVLVLSGCAGFEEKPTSLPVTDDFSDCSTGWSTDVDEFVALSCTDGAYRFEIRNPLQPQNARIFFSEGTASVSVESDVVRVAGPNVVDERGFLLYGVGCWKSQVQGYLFLISPDGGWAILKSTSGWTTTPNVLAESSGSHQVPDLARTNRVSGTCAYGESGSTRLRFSVNGGVVSVVDDPSGFDSFGGFGFYVYSSERGTDVRFDDLVAREPSAAEVERIRGAAPTWPKSVPESRPAQPLCGENNGVRYEGTTPQGAEVCFTLTEDGTAMIESGISFVAASGCPDNAEGTTHSDYRAPVDAAGHVEGAEDFTATIRGADASGTFTDDSICKGKTFTFTARRTP